MKSINKLRSFLLEDNLEIRIYKHKVNVVNYETIGHFDSSKVMIYHKDGCLVVKGDNLVVSRLMSSEVLITGDIKNIELR